jgi:hypothetical protein
VREDARVRRIALTLAAATLVAGCGGSGGKKSTTTATATTQPAKAPSGAQYVPSARHKHRPPGFVYNDEIGENVTGASYDRIIQVFGPPASRHGRCIVYRVVHQPNAKWTFCFKGQKMISASG